ncbi:DUF3137 domain-containing protein [bacterium]|nr:DUF3137 domain-containing protein [bacterium]
MMEEFEKIRVRKYREVKIVGLIAAVIWAIVVYKCGWMIFLHALFFIGIIAGIIIGVKVQNFTRLMKDSCMPRFMKAFGNLTHSIGDNAISNSNIEKSKLFFSYNIRRNDDIFVGSHKGVEFKISETYLAHESGSGKNKSTTTLFKGVLIDFKANKTINNTTIILPRHSRNRKMGKVGTFIFTLISFLVFGIGFTVIGFLAKEYGLMIGGIVAGLILLATLFVKPNNVEILNEIKLEDPEFEKYYTASSSDEVEGRYLITTAFISRFNDLKKAFGTGNICCSFYDDSLMFGIWSDKDLFEIGTISKPLTNAKYIEQFYDQLIAILQIIEHFKLNEKTGL